MRGWCVRDAQLGDCLQLRVLDSDRFDPPDEVESLDETELMREARLRYFQTLKAEFEPSED